MAARGDHGGMPNRHPRIMFDGDRLLVVGQRIRRCPANHPQRVSTQPSKLGRVRSQVGSTTRNRDYASQAQNNNVARPPNMGRWPQSNCSHSPGSANLHDLLTAFHSLAF